MIKPIYKDDWQAVYEVTLSLTVVHYKVTNEIVLVDTDATKKFGLADYSEAKKLADLILELIEKEK